MFQNEKYSQKFENLKKIENVRMDRRFYDHGLGVVTFLWMRSCSIPNCSQ